MKTACLIVCGLMLGALHAPAARAELRAGAARIDITPEQTKLPRGFEGINDRIFVRAIVLDDGHTRAGLVTVDAGAVPTDLWSQVSAQAQAQLGIPVANLLLTATHTHSVPFGMGRELAPSIVKAIADAAGRLKPARMAYGTGASYINVNRNLIDPRTHRWWEGPNYEGPSDKTVAVIRFEALDGKPIGVYYNYAVHGVLNGQLDQISGDIPGAASRYIEDSLDDTAVAVWSTGAAGDQNPIYFQQTYDLREIRIKDYATRGIDISNAMPPGGQGLNRKDPKVAKLMNQQRQMTLSMGQMLGEEVLHAMRVAKPGDTEGKILGAVKNVECPGRQRTNQGRAGAEGAYQEGPPVKLQLGLLMIGDIAIGAVNAEVYNEIAQRLKKESPYAKTMMATLTNGMANSGYIPDDASFGHATFEVLSSRLQPGCAETKIVDGILSMMPRVEY